MSSKGHAWTIGVDSEEQRKACLSCPYPYCYGRGHGTKKGCRPPRKPTYEMRLYESGELKRLVDGGKADVYDD